MEISIEKIDTHLFIVSLFVFVIMVFSGIGINFVIRKKLKIEKLTIPVIVSFIVIGIKLFMQINKIKEDTRYINAFIYLVLLYFGIKVFDSILMDLYIKKSKYRIPKLMHDIVVAVIYFIVFFSVLKMQLKIDLTPLLTTSAVISMVVGLALQDTLSNFIAGVVIHIERPFKYGDWVLINGIEGKVMEINWRTVKVLTFSNDFLVIPNGAVVKDAIINFNYPTSKHLLILRLGVSYDEAPNNVKRVAKEIAYNISNVMKQPEPIITLVKYNDFSIDYEIKLWINDFGKKKKVEDEFYSKLWYKFKRENIKIPYPIREVRSATKNIKEEEHTHNKELIQIVKKVPIFKEISQSIIFEIVEKVKKEIYGEGEILFRQGDSGDSFFIICSGEVLVIIDDKEVADLSKGDFFGEMSLLTGKERTATIKAKKDTECIVLTKEKFSDILNKYPGIVENLSKIITERELENKKKNQSNMDANKINVSHIAAKEEKNLLNKIKRFFNL